MTPESPNLACVPVRQCACAPDRLCVCACVCACGVTNRTCRRACSSRARTSCRPTRPSMPSISREAGYPGHQPIPALAHACPIASAAPALPCSIAAQTALLRSRVASTAAAALVAAFCRARAYAHAHTRPRAHWSRRHRAAGGHRRTTGEAIVFGDSAGMLHVWSDRAEPKVNLFSAPTEIGDPCAVAGCTHAHTRPHERSALAPRPDAHTRTCAHSRAHTLTHALRHTDARALVRHARAHTFGLRGYRQWLAKDGSTGLVVERRPSPILSNAKSIRYALRPSSSPTGTAQRSPPHQ
jgi:hypothetical protein